MTVPNDVPLVDVNWANASRIIRTIYPPINLFEDIADPEDWPALIALEQKSNPRLVDKIGNLELVPEGRRFGGANASVLMAPLTHISPDRPSRFSNARFGAIYIADCFDTAVSETVHHHVHVMSATNEEPGATSQFREYTVSLSASLRDLRVHRPALLLDPLDYTHSNDFAHAVRAQDEDGIVYPSVRRAEGECVALFYPDVCSRVTQTRHLAYHWNGTEVDYIQDLSTKQIWRLAA